MRWTALDGFYLSDERDLVDVVRVHHWLSEESYWAKGRSLDAVARSLDASVVISLFTRDGVQVGITRWVTDGETFAWLSDVFIDTNYRGRGLGRVLIATALEHPRVHAVPRRVLVTSSAHGFYSDLGFEELNDPTRWMEFRSPT